jgi:asparagine synthase (glutamine-hydrolysing)
MCGICGVVQIEGRPRRVVSDDALRVMTDAMVHRGPNDRGLYQDDGIALGVRRLSIVDVDGGHQPFADERGSTWAIQNGEIYNHLELRRSLGRQGHRFRSRCDTEVLPHLYEQHGTAFPTQLRGMFAVGLWDSSARRAVLVRDRLGIKPLYYARRGDLLVFASELKSLLASGLIDLRLDVEAIDAYLTFGFVPGPRTPIIDAFKLMPGHLLVVEGGQVRVERYWRYPEPRIVSERSPAAYREEVIAKLDEAVRLRLMSDVPLGAMLSGGLDSSLVVAMMARHTSEPVKTFSVGFTEAGTENELADARHVAELFGTEHHELELSVAEDTVDLEDLAWGLDEPVADLSALGFLALCGLASTYVTVALSGQGADELLGGYTKHRAASIAGAWQSLPAPVRAIGARVAPRVPPRYARAARTLAAGDPVDRLLAMSGRLDADLRRRLFPGPVGSLDGDAARTAVSDRLNGVPDHPLAATLYIDAQLALVDDMLHYFDRSSMAHSLEVRVPFLDHELVEYCAQIPPGLKVHRLQTKYILKEAARGILPDRIIDKRKIGFFRGSVGQWFQAQASQAVKDYLLQPEPRYAEILDPAAVRDLVETRANGLRSSDSDEHLLLAILMLEVWLSAVARRVAPPPGLREQVTLAR